LPPEDPALLDVDEDLRVLDRLEELRFEPLDDLDEDDFAAEGGLFSGPPASD
jgi:hypothetical protein